MKDDTANGRPGCMFWMLAPFLVIFMVAMPLLIHQWNVTGIIVLGALELFCVLAFLGFLNPRRFWWAWRGLGLILFLSYASYLVDMLIESRGAITIGKSRGDTSVTNALTGLTVFGLPGLAFALFGGRMLHRKKTQDEDDPDDTNDADASAERTDVEE